MKLSPSLLIILSLAKSLAIPFLGASDCFFSALECAKCAGKIISASTNDTTRVRITITETSPKKLPILPSKNRNIEKASMVVIIAEIIGGITSIVPSTAARIGLLPFS